MLTPADKELVAKSVDGGLSVGEEAALRRLYAAGPEAKTLRKQLKKDREALQALEKVKAPATLLPAVMARVAVTSPFETIPGSTLRTPARRRAWVPLAVAAAVILGVGAVTYGVMNRGASVEAFRQEQAQSLPKLEVPRAGDRIAWGPDDPDDVTPDLPPEPTRVTEVAPLPKAVPPAAQPPVYASPVVTPPRLESVFVKLPMIVPTGDLPREDIRKRLLNQLGQQSPMRVDVFSTGDTAKAVEAFVNHAKAAGLSVTVDAVAQERLKRKLPGAWMLFTDALTPAEWVTLLGKLAPPADASPSLRVFDTLHVVTAGTSEKKDLKDLIGLDTTPRKVNAAQSVKADTLEQVSRSLGVPMAKEALLLTYLPHGMRTPQGQSKEAAAWLARHREPKPGAVGVMVVIR